MAPPVVLGEYCGLDHSGLAYVHPPLVVHQPGRYRPGPYALVLALLGHAQQAGWLQGWKPVAWPWSLVTRLEAAWLQGWKQPGQNLVY